MIGRFPIVDISPTVYFGGEFVGVKAIADEEIEVTATIVREGHGPVSADLILFDTSGKEFSRSAMREIWEGTDRYRGVLRPSSQGLWHYAIEAYVQEDKSKNRDAKRLAATSERFPIKVEDDRALIGAWYEFFPRSEGAKKNPDGSITPGNFRTAIASLRRVADMGFDVLYLPPIHPIGHSFRKGKNNSLTATCLDPGVPWAIGSAEGGHDAINPELGTWEDFQEFLTEAERLNVEVALDLALQTSPDHPWVREHPEWFTTRPDGTIAYAENPPKKYQDIYPINFDNDYPGILDEVERIVLLWIEHGIRIFRVDNPHTKPVHFWADLIMRINARHPQVVFLAEAFTRPAMMHSLGKAGFHQSYTYFTWRTTKSELMDYGREVAETTSAFFRPNFWVNTPDILPFHLHTGNPVIFALRATLAATLSPSWGMYAGYELYEHLPLREGAEEYLDSEKYEIKVRDWEMARRNGLTLEPLIATLNRLRKEHKALLRLQNLRFHHTDDQNIIAYSKREGEDLLLIVVNLDPLHAHETTVHWDMYALGLEGRESFEVQDLLDGGRFGWSAHTFIRLDPTRPTGKFAHISQVIL
jgi:starch synthase (maltosyl-transferring)